MVSKNVNLVEFSARQFPADTSSIAQDPAHQLTWDTGTWRHGFQRRFSRQGTD
jgi:hypothetical protein